MRKLSSLTKLLIIFSFIIYANFLVFVLHPQKALAAPLALGQSQSVSNFKQCPSGASSCSSIQIKCNGLSQNRQVMMAEYNATTTTRGVVVLLSGGGGTAWYNNDIYNNQIVSGLTSNGIKVIEASWSSPWTQSASGERSGIVALACRPSTMIKWIYDNKYLPLGISVDKVGKCGFCVSGNSGGSAQTMYSIGYYGLDSIINAAVPTSGPPYSAQRKGCLDRDSDYTYSPHSYPNLDGNYGFLSGGGPCETHDPSWTSYWDADSIDISANDYYHPTTRIQFLIGQDDPRMNVRANDYYNKLVANGNPYLNYQVIAGVGHEMPSSAAGSAVVLASLLSDTGVSTGSGGSGGGGGGGGNGSTPATPPAQSNSNPANTEATADTSNSNSDSTPVVEVNNPGDVPGAIFHAVTRPWDILKLANMPYGWLIISIALATLGGAGIGGYLAFQKHKHRLPDKWHFIQNQKINSTKKGASKIADNNPPAEVVEPTNKNE